MGLDEETDAFVGHGDVDGRTFLWEGGCGGTTGAMRSLKRNTSSRARARSQFGVGGGGVGVGVVGDGGGGGKQWW